MYRQLRFGIWLRKTATGSQEFEVRNEDGHTLLHAGTLPGAILCCEQEVRSERSLRASHWFRRIEDAVRQHTECHPSLAPAADVLFAQRHPPTRDIRYDFENLWRLNSLVDEPLDPVAKTWRTLRRSARFNDDIQGATVNNEVFLAYHPYPAKPVQSVVYVPTCAVYPLADRTGYVWLALHADAALERMEVVDQYYHATQKTQILRAATWLTGHSVQPRMSPKQLAEACDWLLSY